MTAAEAKRAARLLETVEDAQRWLEYINDELALETSTFSIFTPAEFGATGTPIEKTIAREIFELVIQRCDAELATLGVTR